MRIALVKDGVVENIAVWDEVTEWNTSGYQRIELKDSDQVNIGDSYDGVSFVAPPQEISDEP